MNCHIFSLPFLFLTLPIQPAKEFLARNDNPFANLESREICTVGEFVRSGSGNAKGGSNISFPPYLQLAPRRWGQRGQSVAALTARGSGLDCFQPQPWQLVSTRSSRAPCAFPNLRWYPRCWLFSCLGSCSHLRIFLKSTKRSAAAIFGRSAPSLRFMVRFGIFCCQQDFLPCFTR